MTLFFFMKLNKTFKIWKSPWSWQNTKWNAQNRLSLLKICHMQTVKPYPHQCILSTKLVWECNNSHIQIWRQTRPSEYYRDICINSCPGKHFCVVLNKRLKNFVEDHNILHKAQIGFMSNHRTTDHIFSLRTLIDKYANFALVS